jgi:septal ring factor EnvC (AmiA/AmiB activator)
MNDTPTPRSKIILDHIKIYVEADNAAQSYAHYEEVNREIESMERELTAAREELTAVTEQLAEMTLRWELTNDSLFDKRALADRLAEALKELLTTGDNGYGTPTDKAWEMAEQAIAAVKGGSDE